MAAFSDTLSTAWTLARKDLRLFFRDRTALALTFALPILLAVVFGSAMGAMGGGGGGGASPRVELRVEDADATPASARLVQRLTDLEGIRAVVAPEARRAVASGDVAAALIVPEGYGQALEARQIPTLHLLRDPSRTISQQVITGNLVPLLVESVIAELGATQLPVQLMGFAAARELDFSSDVPALLGVVSEDVTGRDDEGMHRSWGASHAVAAMAVMMLMFSLVAAGGSLLEEEEGGTLLRLQLTPAAGPAILTGKLLMLACVGLMQLAVLFAFGMAVFDVPVLDHPLALTLTSIGLVLAATGLGLFFAVVCRSRKQLEGLSTLVILVMSAVGGAWFPREVTPDWFQTVGRLTITAYAMDAFHGILWYGKGLLATAERSGVWFDVAVLYGVGIVLSVLASRLYRRRFVQGA